MALTPGAGSRGWLRFHLLVRFLGLTGLLAAGFGLMLAPPHVDLSSWDAAWRSLRAQIDHGLTPGLGLLLGGVAAALIALVVEAFAGLRFVAGRRSAFGANVALQVALAAALLVGLNVYSFRHYLRLDWTRGRLFTLPADVREQLAGLREPTTIIVYQRHKTFGQLSEKPDAYDYAAERKVVEKVRDLVDQFAELGPQFRVTVLDVEEEGFNDKLAAVSEDAPDLRAAIDRAPENSIFFYNSGKVQRLSFNDFYQLDKTSSQEQRNLVLLPQGVEPFARKVLNIDEKRPRVALGVVHEVLSMEGSDELGMAGARKALVAHGFDTRDLILKKWNEFTGPEPAVLTFDESKYERLEDQVAELDADVKNLEADLQALAREQKTWESSSLDELTKKYARRLDVDRVNEALRRAYIDKVLKPNVTLRELMLKQQREERAAAAKEQSGLSVERLAEQRRIADLRAKADRMLADCDLLILPRMTLFNVARGERIPNRVYQLDQAQAEAVKDFLKAGKPVLFCFGPTNEPANAAEPPGSGPDRLEEYLAQLGIKLPKQTVLFNVESKSFAERRGGLLVLGANVEVPPVAFDWAPGAGRPASKAVTPSEAPPNPVRESMRLTARGVGKEQTLDLRVRHPRPVYYQAPPGAKAPAYQPEFMMTDAAAWNEDQPFPTRERTPRFEPSKPDDPARGTPEEKRLGPFPIGVAVETTVPADWSSEKGKATTVRVAAIGQGGVFMGPTLSPIKERLLLDLCNWLMGRDDLLTKERQPPWHFPRVSISEGGKGLWERIDRWGLPGLSLYLGVVVWMFRRVH